jgi:hypothetical protein
MRRAVGILVSILLAIGVVAAVVVGTSGFGLINRTTPVSGVIGSEKARFFEDDRVQEIFRDNGWDVSIETAGSRQIATDALDEADYDFAFPSSAPAARKIDNERDVIGSYDPFFSPMVVATFQPIVEILTGAGVVEQRADGSYTFDVAAYLELVEQDARWTDLSGNEDGQLYPADREVLLTSTDVRRSNSAAMYLSIASYVANGGQVVSTPEQEDAVFPLLRTLFLDQGFSESSSEGPFEDYLTLGLGRAPMIMAYESQFLDRQIQDPGRITDDMVLLYPSPTVISQHTLLSLTEGGDAVGRLLTENEDLQRLLAEYGFRVPDRAVFASVLEERGVEVPPEIVDTADTPSYEVLERMIQRLEGEYEAAGAPVAPTEEGDAAPTEEGFAAIRPVGPSTAAPAVLGSLT